MMQLEFLVLFAVLLSAVDITRARPKCVASKNEEYSSCSCTMSDGSGTINLAPLQNDSVVPRFTTVDNITHWQYSYNPCTPFDMFVGQNNSGLGYKPCKHAAMARWTTQSTHQCFSLGPPESAVWEYEPLDQPQKMLRSNLTLTFTFVNDTLTKNQGVISLVCNKNMTRNETEFKYIGLKYDMHSIYYFSLESKCSCAGECGEAPTPPTTAAPPGTTEGLIIGLSVAAGVLLLIAIIAIAVCCSRRGYASV
ncbi:uncharacterized protein LOC116620840 isoform X2 [Nematostella vectensis]|uniref:uncharacterized protein LOC116620840 isoform X2 n=1 Tax=Nematostella vectensis TaxID=45351 RepID=UPI00138FB14A|nr:uncharacterized protein LOC116620840 isoform X2 [Nematostella vectensis]